MTIFHKKKHASSFYCDADTDAEAEKCFNFHYIPITSSVLARQNLYYRLSLSMQNVHNRNRLKVTMVHMVHGKERFAYGT